MLVRIFSVMDSICYCKSAGSSIYTGLCNSFKYKTKFTIRGSLSSFHLVCKVNMVSEFRSVILSSFIRVGL